MFKRIGLIAGLLVAVATVGQAQITVPNTLTAGQVIRASELNTNFAALGDKALNRVTGGAIQGNVTLSTDVTFDGVDISDFLLTTGEVRAGAAGTNTAPAFSLTSDTNTGLYFPAADSLAMSLGGTQRLLLNSSGLTVFGVNILNSSGLIPAISSTYFASLSGANLTTLNASNISSGSLADARLSANVPLLNASTNTFTGNASFGGTLGVTGTSTLGAVNAAATAVSTLRVGTSTTAGYVLTSDASGNATWQSAGAATGIVPAGMIALFDTACPATWTRFSALDSKFPRGGSSYSLAGGGSDTHTHNVDIAIAATSGDGFHNHSIDPPSTTSSSNGAHTHTAFPGGGSTGTADLSHTHSGTTDSGGSHTHTLSSGGGGQSGSDVNIWTSVTDSSGSHTHTFTTGSASTSMSHSHSIAATATSSDGAHTHTVDIAAFTSANDGFHQHTIDLPSTASTSSSNVPAYVQMVFCKKD